jgi:hypothetical protein
MLSNSLVTLSFLFLSICSAFDSKNFLFSSSASGVMRPLDRSGARSGPGAGGAQDALECHGPQDPSTELECGDGTPIPEMVPEMDTTTAVGGAASIPDRSI